MSTTVDERVVEMRFDNKNFESNVATSMSTLEKLKQKLKFDGASKGLEGINSASKRINMSGLGSSVDAVSAKFSALQVMGVTALANITNSAVNAGKKIVSALTIDPVKSGFQEYETQINAVQTILANTSSKGSTINDVNAALDELNHYADLTIYNFTEMTRNIGTFTAAGVDLNTSVSAIQGIANLAAVSGSTSQQASTAMYQLSQALASGTVKLQDWNSVVNAGMGGEVFQNALKKTSELLGTGAEEAIKSAGSFRESLKEGWLTTEVLTKTLNKFTTSGANEYVAEYTGLSVDAVEAALESAEAQYGEADAIDKASEALANKSGKNKDEIKSVLEMAKTATDAATKVKTFSQLWDVLKEAAQSGWSKTWQIIIGDFEEAKALLTPLADFFTEIINKMSDFRNTILEIALNFAEPWKNISDKIKGITETITKAADKLEYFQDIVNKVWRGDYNNWGDNPDRRDLLKAAGYDDRVVQELVNKGYQYKLTMEDVIAAHEKFGLTLEGTTEETQSVADAMAGLSDEQLKQAGLTEDEISLYRALEKEADRLGISVSDLADEMSNNNGRTLLIDSFKNIGEAILEAGKVAKEAWVEIFNPPGVGELAIKLYGAIKSLNEFTKKLSLTDAETGELNETGKKLQSTFKGLFAVLDIVRTIVGGGLSIAFKVLSAVLNAFDLDILDVTASIGDGLVAFHDWLLEGNALAEAFNNLVAKLPAVIEEFEAWFEVFKETPAVKQLLDAIQAIKDAIESFSNGDINSDELARALGTNLAKALKALPGIAAQIGKDILSEFMNMPSGEIDFSNLASTLGTKLASALNNIPNIIQIGKEFIAGLMNIPTEDINFADLAITFGTKLASALRSLPETAVQIGKDFIAGFQNGVGDSISGVIGQIISFCYNFVSAFAEELGVHSPSWKAYETATDFFQGFINGASDMIGSVVSVLETVGGNIVNVFKSFWDFITDESGNIEWGKLFAGGIIIAMVMVLKKLATATSEIAGAFSGVSDLLIGAGSALKGFGKVLNGVAWDLKAQAMQKMAIAIAVLVAAIWVLTTIDDPAKLWQAVGVIVVLAGVLIGLSVAMDKLSSASVAVNGKAKTLDIKGIQNSIIQIGLALLLMAAAVKLIGGMDADEAKQGFLGLAGMAVGMIVFIAALGKLSKHDGDVSAVGSMMKKLAVAMILMAVACKLIGMLSAEDMLQGAAFAAGFAIFVIAITKVAKSAGNNVSKVGGMVLKLTIAMMLMVAFCKLVGMLSTEEMLKGAAFAAAFVVFVGALVKVTKIGKKQQIAQISGLVLSISVSLLMLVGVCKLVGMLTVEEMIKGAAFVAAFVILLKVLMKTLTISNEQQMAKVAGTILAMSAAIAILAAVAILLSFVPIDGLAKGIIAVGLLSVMMTAMIKALKGAQNVKGAIMMMAIAIGVMAASIVALSFIDTADLAASTGAMVAVMSAFALMVKSMKGIKNVKVGPLVALTGVVLILAGIIYILQDVDPLSAISTAGSLAVLMLSMSVTLKIISTVGSNATSALKGILLLTAMAVPLLAFVGVLAVMQNVTVATNNVIALVALAAALTLLLIPLTVVGNFVGSALLGVLSLTAMAVPLLAFILVLKQMDGIENASEKITALTTMMTSMTILLAILAVVGLGGPAAIIGIGSLVVLFAAIGGLAVAVGALMEKFPSIQKFLDTGLPVLEQLAGSIGTMIGKFIGGIGEGLSDSLVKMGEDIAAFMDQLAIASDNAAGVKGESFDGVKQLMGVMADIGLTTVGTTFADIFTLGGTSMEKFQTDGVAFFDAMKAIGEASAGVTVNEEAMQSVIGVAQGLADLQSSLEPIGGVVSWFTGRDDLGTFGDNIGQFMTSMKLALGSLEGFTFNEEALSAIITASTNLATLQSSLEPIGGVITWFTGRDDLGTFGVNVGQFMFSMKTALSSLDGVTFNEEALASIITAATKLGTLQASLEPIGGVITWFTGRDDLGTFGTNVGQFILSMKTALGSLEGVTFNEEALTSIITAATKLGTLQASLEPIGGVISWFVGRDDLGTFGASVSQFIGSMKTALATLDGVTLDEEALSSVITAAERLASLQSTLEPMGGVISWFTGRDDLGTFGTNIGLFADGMAKLKTGMGEDGISEDVVTSVTNAGNAIIALQKALPEEGWFDGKMNLSEFSDYVTDFGTAMATFSSKATEIDSGMVSICINTAYKIKNLIESLVDLDTSGVETFTGIGTGGIGADGPAYDIARAIAKFSEEVADIDTTRVSVAVSAATRLKSLINGLVGLDTSGVDKFKPGKIGDQMQTFSDKVSGVDTGKVSNSISSANKLKNFISSLSGLDTSGVSKFKPGAVGSALNAYSSSISGFNTESVNSSIAAATRLKNFITSLAGLDSSGVANFKSAVESLAQTNLAGIQETFNSAANELASAGSNIMESIIKGMTKRVPQIIKTCTTLMVKMRETIVGKAAVFTAAGLRLMQALATGILSGRGRVVSAATSSLSYAASSARGYYSSFYSAGAYLVSGFAAGISANAYKAAARARAMARAAAQAAKDELDINSPSKVFRKIGYSVPEGFAMGIDRMTGMVKKSSVSMTDEALDGTKRAIAGIAQMMSVDDDYQPTITPVLDLSDVESGAGSIAGMFSSTPSIGIKGNLRAIGSMMNQNSQNGSAEDIVTAIDKLRKDLGNVGNTTYTINGVTYDDGSNIHDAMSAIVRQARIERRV